MIRNPSLKRFLAAGLLALLGCGDATAPLPQGATLFTPPPQYALWWSLAEACSGLEGDMSAITWYTVSNAAALGSDHVDGVYFTLSHRIVLLGDSTSSGPLVRHEMLHALGAAPGHPAKYFQNLCGGFVDCATACIKDGGGLAQVDTTGPIVEPSQLEVSAFTDPAVPNLGDSSWVALIVELTNPYSYAVRVHLTEVFNTPASETFGYSVSSCPPDGFIGLPIYDWIPGDRMVLGPGEVRHRVFDIPDWRLCKTLIPYFNKDTTPPLTVRPIPSANRAAARIP